MLSLFRVAAKIAPPRQIHVAWPRKAFRTERLSLTCATRSRSGLPLGVRAASSDTSPPSDSSTPCESTGPSPPAKDPPSDSDSSKSGKNIVETPSNVPSQSTPMTKRRAKRASRSANKMSAPTEEPSQVYVPSIPASFLATNYHDIGSNKYRDSPMPYHVEECILDEFLNTTASCLLSQVPPQLYIQRMPARYNNILLSCLNEGSSRMLETMTHYAAAQVGADVITVDMQDLMELTADIFNSKGAGNPWPVDNLSRGFNPFIAAAVPTELVDDMIDDNFGDFGDSMDDDDDDDDEQERATLLSIISRNQETSKASAMAVNEKFSKFWTALLLAQPPKPLGNVQPPPSKILYLKDIDDIVQTPLGSIVLPTLISTTINLRRAGQNVMVIAGLSPSLISSKNKYDDEVADDEVAKRATSVGDIGASGPIPLNVILQKLRSDNPNDLPNGLPALTYDTFPGPTQCLHHISIPPYIPPTYPPGPVNYTQLLQSNQGNTEQFKRDKADRIKEINSRNLLTVLRFRGGFLDDSDSSESVLQALPGISSQVWGFLKVYRIISNAIGARCLSDIKKNDTMPTKVLLTLKDLSHGLTISNETAKLRQSTQSRIIKGKAVPIKPSFRVEECDRYERRLLGSIVDPSQIKTTFKTTIIPPETIQTLQTMITLPLVRPQLFSYGLLQDEFLSGLLLFGPPGTGKTLLAKAVARESGARMLEIKASNIFDMFVGEGEKNVSAVFSLARKLSPCVIFLDEVDSIFCSRSRGGAGVGGNSSQREILNQFMVEWDGLRSSGQNHGIILMASTNRPFELDDAVLRRLPRRIMVDLPSEEAREQILKVYLSKEQLDGDIDIKELAKKTEFYSGSDLKNLCVSATLTCVREDVENEIMATNARKEPSSTVDDSAVEGARPVDKVIDLSLLLDQNKETLSSEPTLTSTVARILRKRHFEKALTQITPSCSENMSSLTELRKWDGLYGDGGNRRRKVLRGIGFEAGSPSPSHGDRRQDTSTSLKRL